MKNPATNILVEQVANKPWKVFTSRLWRCSFNFPFSFRRGIDRPKIFIRQTRRNRDQTNTVDLFYKFALACVQFRSVCEAEQARVLTCQKNNQPTKKERKEKNKHWNTILWHGSSIEKILVHRRMVERVRKRTMLVTRRAKKIIGVYRRNRQDNCTYVNVCERYFTVRDFWLRGQTSSPLGPPRKTIKLEVENCGAPQRRKIRSAATI